MNKEWNAGSSAKSLDCWWRRLGFSAQLPDQEAHNPHNSSSGESSTLLCPLWELHSNVKIPLPACPYIIKNKSSNVSSKSSKLEMKICLFCDFYVVKDTEIGTNGFERKQRLTVGD